MSEDLAVVEQALRMFLHARLPAGAEPEVVGLRRSGTGSSRENWPFDGVWSVDGTRVTHRLLLRRDPPAAVVDTGREAEFRLLRALHGTPVPVPEVHWLDDTGAELLRPGMVVERRAGVAHRGVLRDTDPLRIGAPARLDLARRLCDVLADVQAVDVTADAGVAGVLPDPGPRPAEHEVERWAGELAAAQLAPQPGLHVALAWLRAHPPAPPARRVLVHGDLRPANVLVHDGAFDVLLDWELARLGDPLDDLGWYTAPLYAREHFLPGAWEPADLLRRYTARTGVAVDPAALAYWQVLATFRLAVIALAGVRAFCAGTTDRPAAPADAVVGHVLAAVHAADRLTRGT